MIHSKIDLNLFSVLATVYQEGSITAAAAKMHLTQPAVSHALSRLRDKFNDPLFVRHGRKMVATQLTQNMMPEVLKAIAVLESTLVDTMPFDIHQHKREFKLGLRDILEALYLPRLVTDIVNNTPNLKITSYHIPQPEMEKVLVEQEMDLVIDVLTPTSKDIKNTLMCKEHFSLLSRQDHPILQNLTLDAYLSYDQAIVDLNRSTVNIVDMALAREGRARNVALKCEHYFAAASVICGCDLLLIMPHAYACVLQEKMPIVVSELPFEVPLLPVHMYWHEKSDHDPVNRWMRQKMLGISEQLFPGQLTQGMVVGI